MTVVQAKENRIALIKVEANSRIASTDWKLGRAKERYELNQQSLSEYNSILVEREQVRSNSNIAEASVNSLSTIANIESFTW